MATTASGFWYPDEGTAFNINTIMSTAMSSVESKVGPHVLDTGWVDCPLKSGVSQQGGSLPQVRRIGKIVYMRWGVSGAGMPANTGKDVCTVPTGFRPTEWKYHTAVGQSANAYGRITVRSDGNVRLDIPSATAAYWIFDSAWWAID